MDPWQLREYKRAFSAFCEKCDNKLRTKIDQRMVQLEERGNLAVWPVSRKLTGYEGLYELRANIGKRHVRFFYFFHGRYEIIFVYSCFKEQHMKGHYKKAANIRKTLLQSPELLDGVTEVH